MNAKRVLTVLFAFVMVCSTSVVAMAGGGQHYPNGVEGCFCGAAPPPGWWVINYFLYYNADEYKDDAGNTVTAGPFADFDATVWANVVRVIYSSEIEVLGGTWLAHVLVPYMNVDYDSLGVDDSGLADIIVDPFIVAWHWGDYHAIAAVEIFVPTGDYTRGNPASVGKNFWTIEPVFAVTGMYENGLSWSVKLMYDFNTKNDDWLNPTTATVGELEPGQEFHLDYAVDYNVGGGFRVGVAGWYYKQITDDEFDGVEIEGDRGQVFAIGPLVKYDLQPNVSFIARYAWELEAENRPEGNAFWFKFIYGF